jgi:site-specific DNA-adenine methylase
MSHFYFAYDGNKRQETKFLEDVDFSKYDIIVEPFCGSCAVSLWLYFNKGYKDKTYVINDFDSTLMAFYEEIANEGSEDFYDYCDEILKRTPKITEEEYKQEISKRNDNLKSWFFWRKCYDFRLGRYPSRIIGKGLSKRQTKTDEFFKQAVLYNMDGWKLIQKYKDNPKAFIFLDPPYFNSSNVNYTMKEEITRTGDGEDDYFIDGTKIFVDIAELLEDEKTKAKCTLIINGNAILERVYKGMIIKKYKKEYQQNMCLKDGKIKKRSTYHILVGN